MAVPFSHADETAPTDTPREKFLTVEVEQAIDRGLDYLAKQQKKNGCIGSPPVAGTGIALLAFLASGHMPGKGVYGAVVEKGVEFLLNAQNPSTGMLGNSMYEHGFALLALADVWGEYSDDHQRLEESIEQAVALAVAAHKNNPKGVWHYGPQDKTADISVTSAVLQAMRASREAFFEVPETVMQKAAAFVLSCANNTHGGFAYQPGRAEYNNAKAGIGLLCLLACGESGRPQVKKGINYLVKHPQMENAYAAYYSVVAMYQARTLVGEQSWNTWYPRIQSQILKSQLRNGSFPKSMGGPDVDTGLMLIALSVQKGLLPLFQR